MLDYIKNNRNIFSIVSIGIAFSLGHTDRKEEMFSFYKALEEQKKVYILFNG